MSTEVRTRRKVIESQETSAVKNGSALNEEQEPEWMSLRTAIGILILMAIVTIIVLFQLGFKPKVKVHAVMMDAGSTGSRILVFTFTKSSVGRLKLIDEFFKEVKPGISSYVDHPEKGAESIAELFEDAKGLINSEAWPKTPVSLKATAGLRMLPQHDRDNLLNSIREVFAKSGFAVKSESVSIIDGISEGLYSWTTINYLLNHLPGFLKHTVATIDLGGGSVQLAFVPNSEETLADAEKENILTAEILGVPATFYIHSYSELGLMAMRFWVLTHSPGKAANQTTQLSTGLFDKEAKTEWSYQGKTYSIKGTASVAANQRFQVCKGLMTDLIKKMGVRQIKELRQRSIFAVSYFFDLAVESSLIGFDRGGMIRVQDYCDMATKACENPGAKHPFACIDFTYLCTLLKDGFGLSLDQSIKLQKKIDGHETSWALGAALLDLQKEIPK